MPPVFRRPNLPAALRLALVACCFSVMLAPSVLAQGKPDPPMIGPGSVGGGSSVTPAEKADPNTLGILEVPGDVVQRFRKKYMDEFGPPIAIVAFNSQRGEERIADRETTLLAAQIRRVWTGLVPGLTLVNAEADALNQAQRNLALERIDPAGAAEALGLQDRAELVLLVEALPNPNARQADQPDFDVVFRLLDLKAGVERAAGRAQWFDADGPLAAEILARAITRDVWNDWAPDEQAKPVVTPQRFTLDIVNLADRAQAQAIADQLTALGVPTRLQNFTLGADQHRATLHSFVALDLADLAAATTDAGAFVGVPLEVTDVRGTRILLQVGSNLDVLIGQWKQWRNDRRPSDVVILGGWSVDDNRGNAVNDLANIDLTGDDLVRGLTAAMTGRLAPVRNQHLAELRDARIAQALADADEPALLDMLARQYPDQIIWVVSARSVKRSAGEDKGTARVRNTLRVLDTRNAQTLVSFNDDFLVSAHERDLQRKADEYLAKAIEQLTQNAEPHPTRQTVLIAGLESPADRDLLQNAIAAALPNGDRDLTIRDATQASAGDQAAVEFELWTDRDPAGVSRLVRTAIFDRLGWPVHEAQLQPALILRVKNGLDTPEWAMLTSDEQGASGGSDLRQRVQQVAQQLGNPQIFTFIQSADQQVPTAAMDAMQNQVNDYLASAGLRVLDSAVAPELAQRLRFDPNMQDDFSVTAALRDQVRADWLVLGFLRDGPDGSTTLAGNFRLVDLRKGGQYLAGVNVPDHDSRKSKRITVDQTDPRSVARYVAGRVLGGLLRLEGQPNRLEVIVRGAQSGEQVIALSRQLASNLPAVAGVEGLYHTPAASGFFLVHRGPFEALAAQLDRVREGFPMKLDHAGFDRGAWTLTVDGPPAPGPIVNILPGQGIVAPDPDDLRARRSNNVAVNIGVNDLLHADNDLRYAVPDARALSQTMINQAGYQRDRVTLLIDGANNGNDTPTKARILEAVKDAAQLAGPDDALIVSFSGHGLQIPTDTGRAASVLCPADFRGTVESGVLVSELRQIIESSKARTKLLLIDSCHSGGQFELPPLNPQQDFEGDGLVTLASCTFGQTSLENPQIGFGVFTYHVLRALSGEARGDDKAVTVFELFDFVSKRVPEAVKPHEQTPVFMGTLRDNFAIVEFQ